MWTSTCGEGGQALVDASRWGTGVISMWTSIQKIRAHMILMQRIWRCIISCRRHVDVRKEEVNGQSHDYQMRYYCSVCLHEYVTCTDRSGVKRHKLHAVILIPMLN